MNPHPIEQVLAGLNAGGVRYLVVGGVAVVLHGHLRTTADLDLVVALDDANASRAVSALQGLGFTPRAPVPAAQFADAAARAGWIEDRGLTVFSLASPQVAGLEVDLFVKEPSTSSRPTPGPSRWSSTPPPPPSPRSRTCSP